MDQNKDQPQKSLVMMFLVPVLRLMFEPAYVSMGDADFAWYFQ